MNIWSTPGSILLSGEYRISEDGSSALSVAIVPRSFLKIDSSFPRGISTFFGKEEKQWNPDSADKNTLCSSVYKSMEKPVIPQQGAIVDTRTFYDNDGRKWGFGSSAAAAILISRFFIGGRYDLKTISETALKAHRLFQGGRGSGYDILTSINGGIGICKGGPHPEWEALKWPTDVVAWLIPGQKSISSSEAILNYSRWKSDKAMNAPGLLADLDQANQLFIASLKASAIDSNLFHIFDDLGCLGAKLGSAIGVPANPIVPKGIEIDITRGRRKDVATKCLGAGDELTLLIHAPDALSKKENHILSGLAQTGKIFPLRVESQGLRQEKHP